MQDAWPFDPEAHFATVTLQLSLAHPFVMSNIHRSSNMINDNMTRLSCTTELESRCGDKQGTL